MSYSQTFHTSVTIPYSHSYPSSENGGTVHGTVTEPISIEVIVHDEDLIDSASGCVRQVEVLGRSIAVSADRQSAAKAAAAKAISKSLVGGFLEYTIADFSQRLVELENKVSSETPKIMSYLEQLKGVKERMEHDFSLISRRYSEIFSSLDDELYRGIYRLYAPCFQLVDDVFKGLIISFRLEAVSDVIGYGELAVTESAILASYIKEKLKSAMDKLAAIAYTMKKLDSAFSILCSGEPIDQVETVYLPAILFEHESEESHDKEISCHFRTESGRNDSAARSRILDAAAEGGMRLSTEKDREIVESFLLSMMESIKDGRKRREIMRLWEESKGGIA